MHNAFCFFVKSLRSRCLLWVRSSQIGEVDSLVSSLPYLQVFFFSPSLSLSLFAASSPSPPFSQNLIRAQAEKAVPKTIQISLSLSTLLTDESSLGKREEEEEEEEEEDTQLLRFRETAEGGFSIASFSSSLFSLSSSCALFCSALLDSTYNYEEEGEEE